LGGVLQQAQAKKSQLAWDMIQKQIDLDKIICIYPYGSHVYETATEISDYDYIAVYDQIEDTKEAKTWEIAEKLIPLRLYWLFKQDKLNAIDAGATGVYIFYSFTRQKFYVGRSEKADLKSRLQKHLQNQPKNEFHIFNYRLCAEPKEAHDLECALFHLLPSHLLINKEHPSAFIDRECTFCISKQVEV
jgi:predicted nucleotidyltransferase